MNLTSVQLTKPPKKKGKVGKTRKHSPVSSSLKPFPSSFLIPPISHAHSLLSSSFLFFPPSFLPSFHGNSTSIGRTFRTHQVQGKIKKQSFSFLFLFFFLIFIFCSYYVIQKWILKVSIHCEGCKKKVKKILQQVPGKFLSHFSFPI